MIPLGLRMISGCLSDECWMVEDLNCLMVASCNLMVMIYIVDE
jgi:hypothetical protein